jgi:hypothetical protein
VSYEQTSILSGSIAHATCCKKLFLSHYMPVLYQSTFCRVDHVSLIYLMLERQLSHLNGRKLGTYILCMSNLAFPVLLARNF